MGNLMPYNMYAAIGGGTLTFQQQQPIQQQSTTTSLLQQRYERQSYFESHLIPNCAGHPRIRNPNHR
uniref:Uncharacterized protein n=1 Tax=Syphacia muris TaxID=451379 RepID=A0A0N5AYY8_9BILA